MGISGWSAFGLALGIIAVVPEVAIASPVSPDELCFLQARSYSHNFGRSGRKGPTGSQGASGQDGGDREVFLDGSPMRIDLSGQDGAPGGDGEDGYHADCGSQPRDIKYDLQAPDGGDGGNGGNGGDGGNGGTLTVYYTDPMQLQNLFLDAAGGEGGEPGRSGEGGEGCRCRRPSWEITTCTGEPDTPEYKCETERFYCDDGRDGRSGRRGNKGRSGQPGRLVLIQRAEPLPPNNARTTLSLLEAQNGSPTLYLNRWRSQNGAATLLAPGSIVADNYQEFRDRISGNFKLTWQADKPIQDFATETVSVRLTEGHTVEADFSENAWLDGTWTQQEGYSEYIVTDAFVKDEALRLLPSSLSGNQNNLTLEILDVAAKSDELTTQFLIAYRVSNRLRYEGAIPAELISREGNIFRIDIGKLPIDPDYLEVGTRAEVEIIAIRAFNHHQAQQVMTLRRTLRD